MVGGGARLDSHAMLEKGSLVSVCNLGLATPFSLGLQTGIKDDRLTRTKDGKATWLTLSSLDLVVVANRD